MYLVDTNIFLEVLLEREKSKDCVEFLEELKKGKITGVITSFTLHSIAVILERLKNLKTYKTFLETINGFEGLLFYSTLPNEGIEICDTSRKMDLDFDDGLTLYVAKKFDLDIVSFDKDFDNKGIKRLEPKDIKSRND